MLQVPGGPLEFDETKRQGEPWLAQLARAAVSSINRETVPCHTTELRTRLRRSVQLARLSPVRG